MVVGVAASALRKRVVVIIFELGSVGGQADVPTDPANTGLPNSRVAS